MLQSSRFFAVLLSCALTAPLVVGCTASASFKAGGEDAKPPPPPPHPPPPATPERAPPPHPPPSPRAPRPPAATTPAPAPAATDPNAKPVLKKDKLEIPGEIVFENASAVLKPESDA